MEYSYSFFAGANSENGFVSYYGSVDSDNENTAVYNVIGGPGTGKSSLLNKLCKVGEDLGCRCERYFCSSDPNSLDAVKITNLKNGCNVFACDSTPPHPRPLTTPGAVGKLVDLTRFWNEVDLRANKDRIISLQTKKSDEYGHVYEHLKIAGAAFREAVKGTVERINEEEASQFVRKLGKSNTTSRKILRPVAAISMQGEKSLDNRGFGANERYYIADKIECAALLHYLLFRAEKVEEIWVAPDPIVPGCFNEIYHPASSVCISCVDAGGWRFPTDKLIRPHPSIADYITTYEAHKEAALAHLINVRELHFELESIYGKAMDFERKEKYDADIVKDVSSLL